MYEFTTGNGFLVYLVAAAGLLHASLQLPLATLTHALTHNLGRNRQSHTVPLAGFFLLGFLAALSTLALASLLLLSQLGINQATYLTIGALICIAGAGIMLAYFRDNNGAALWVPRRFVQKLYKLTEKKTLAEAYGSIAVAGFLAVFYEIIFCFPLVLCAIAISASASEATISQHMLTYALAASAPLIVAMSVLAGGTSPVRIHKWRIESKRFWQFFLGLTYICFGLYIASGQFAMHY